MKNKIIEAIKIIIIIFMIIVIFTYFPKIKMVKDTQNTPEITVPEQVVQQEKPFIFVKTKAIDKTSCRYLLLTNDEANDENHEITELMTRPKQPFGQFINYINEQDACIRLVLKSDTPELIKHEELFIVNVNTGEKLFDSTKFSGCLDHHFKKYYSREYKSNYKFDKNKMTFQRLDYLLSYEHKSYSNEEYEALIANNFIYNKMKNRFEFEFAYLSLESAPASRYK